MILNTQRQAGRGGSVPILTRADVELLRSNVESSTRLDLSFQNLQHIDLSYMDLQGANLRGADLQGAHLRGTNLSDTELQGANLSDADLDGANLSRAHLSDNEANRVNLHQAKLSYATLRGLDLPGFDPVKIRRLFPQGFNFVVARQLFDAWIMQSGDSYSEQEINAMWIGFAHQICDLYHEHESKS